MKAALSKNHVLIALLRAHTFKEITDSTDATDLFFHGFYYVVPDFVRHWRMDLYGFSLRLRQSRAVRRNEIPEKSKTKRNP